MYIEQGVFGLEGMSGHPLSTLRHQFPWISPGEILSDGAVSYSVLKHWDGGVRLALYDRGGIMVDSQDFFHAPTPVSGMGAGPEASQRGIFAGQSGIFNAMGMGNFPTLPGQPNWGMFSPREGVFGPMGVQPHRKAPKAYAFSGLGAFDTPTSLSVRVVQRALLAAGQQPSPGTPDNRWGPNTQRSLSAWLTTNAGQHRISASNVRATFGNIAPRASSITLPNALASVLEQLSGRYQASPGTTRPSTPPSSTTPSAPWRPDGRGGPAVPGTTGKPQTGADVLPLPGSGFAIDMPVMGAPLWVWLAAGGLVLVGGGFLAFSRKGKRRPRPTPRRAVAANRRRRRRTSKRRRRAA